MNIGRGTTPTSTFAGGRLRLRTLILIRWIAIAGQLAALLTTHIALGYEVPIVPALIVVGASLLLNVAAMIQRRTPVRLGDRDATLYLGYDLIQLAVLLFLTGGVQNPFVVLLLAPLTVSATILSRRSTIILTGLLLVCVTALTVWHYPLPSAHGGMSLPAIYNFGVWVAMSLAASFITAYVWRVADENRRLGEAVNASRLALARAQQVSALGALAAAAAHELGTPLGTIAVVAREMAREVPPDSPLAEDVGLLLSESERCREILARLAERPEADGGDPYERLSVTGLIEAAAAPHRRPDIDLVIEGEPLDGSPEPVTRRTPELMHGIGNLLQNALQFARRRVSVRAGWSRDEVRVTIADDGPGFPPSLLGRLGEPYLSERGEGGHMGLGIFIAATLLEQGGADLQFANAGNGGAQVVVRWKRDIFELMGKE